MSQSTNWLSDSAPFFFTFAFFGLLFSLALLASFAFLEVSKDIMILPLRCLMNPMTSLIRFIDADTILFLPFML